MRQAAAEDGREDGAVPLHLLDERVERVGELLLDGSVLHAAHASLTEASEAAPQAAANGRKIQQDMPAIPATVARQFARIGREFHTRGWVLGTSGNFSAVLSQRPLRLAITASGVHKGALQPRDLLVIGADGQPNGKGMGKPSAETALHLLLVRARGAGAVLHTHSVWSTMLSERHAAAGGLAMTGFEMLKGLEGVRTHEHTEWLPIVDNDQDVPRMAGVVEAELNRFPDAHAFLIRRHGLYTWGRDLEQATRHIEILEFLLEATGRT